MLPVLLALAIALGFPHPPRAMLAELAEALEAMAASIYGSRELDGAVALVWAVRESGLRWDAVNPDGPSRGLWQQKGRCGRGAVRGQAGCWLDLVRRGAAVCPDHPAAIVWGACHARDTLTGRDVSELAAGRERRARALLEDLEGLP